MARRVFFSFHYKHDIWRANQVRMTNVVAGPDAAGFFDHSEYDEAKRKGDEAIKRMILRHLDNTTVTVVLIGRHTATRPWVQFEIAESIKRKNGLLGVYIHHLKDPNQPPDSPFVALQLPLKPLVPQGIPFPTYVWDRDLKKFTQAIEEAGKRADTWRNPPRTILGGFRPFPPPRMFGQ